MSSSLSGFCCCRSWTAESVCYICYEVMKCFFFLELVDFFVLELISSYSWSCDFFAPVILARFFFSFRDRGIGLGEARGDVVPFVF